MKDVIERLGVFLLGKAFPQKSFRWNAVCEVTIFFRKRIFELKLGNLAAGPQLFTGKPDRHGRYACRDS